MSTALAKRGLWMSTGEMDACRCCDSTEFAHVAWGFCTRCWGGIRYHSNAEHERHLRKLSRIRNDVYEKRKPAVKAWLETHAEENRKYKREYARRQSPRFVSRPLLYVEADAA